MKLKKAYQETIELLREAYDLNEATSITRLLFEELELDHMMVFTHPDYVLSEYKHHALSEFRSKLLKRIPVQYVLGYTWFHDHKLLVGPGCLIPRPETEELIYRLLEEKHDFKRVLDIGTGSGCLAISIRAEFPEARVWAMDKYPETLEWAKKNASLNKQRINFIIDDILDPAYEKYPADFDLVVSNPPYVRKSEKKNMHNNVLENEPFTSLFVEDADPLVFYRAIHDFCIEKLKPGGHLFLEINEALGKETAELYNDAYFEDVEILKDIHNKDRFIKAYRNEQEKKRR